MIRMAGEHSVYFQRLHFNNLSLLRYNFEYYVDVANLSKLNILITFYKKIKLYLIN